MALQRILNYWNSKVLWECEADDVRAAVIDAVATGANLRDADLTGRGPQGREPQGLPG